MAITKGRCTSCRMTAQDCETILKKNGYKVPCCDHCNHPWWED
jgi:hypothetical protein